MTWLTAYVWLAWVIRAGMVPTVLRRQFTPGASLAWLGIVFLHPYVGLVLYLTVGERRLGRGREALHRELIVRYRSGDSAALVRGPDDDPKADEAWAPVAVQAQKVGRLPVVGGNDVEFIGDSTGLIDRLVADIESAKSNVHLLYYLFSPDQTGQRVAAALMAAAGRGVSCKVLADEFASRVFFRRNGLAAQLKEKGVRVAEALPSSPLRRRDLRNHRKLAIVDGIVAYAGSQNLINADYGGRRGAPWHDLTGRFTGPVLCEFAAVFAEDWAFETGEMLDLAPAADGAGKGGVRMQVVPTGPVEAGESYRRVLLGAIQSANRRIVITTPYFVPDEPALVAILMAADRGVDVKLILPQTPDHLFTAAAGRSHFTNLMQAGVSIHLYQPGLIHSKTTTVDDKISLFGSANLDVRSFNLNFELSVLLYGSEVTERLHGIQMGYLKQSLPLDQKSWSARSSLADYGDSAVALLSPLL